MQPVKVFRIGAVSASVFRKEVETEKGKRTIHNVDVHRSYFDEKDKEWKKSSSFGLTELLQASNVLQSALDYVTEVETAVVG